ncbi:MAG TPA: helix-turn-helix domain-containing protein [Solirubrobacteraceae bacterium]|nr:helix-turn-helix domain-containing protein [Solirubrobacteraceae bacterium]
MAAEPRDRPTRKDAVRNRAVLVEAAATVFREEGLDASVNAVARAAGVNVATLYRHFPTKGHLVDAVLDALLAPLVSARDRALATPAGAPFLAGFLREAAQLQSRNRGLLDAFGRHPSAPDVGRRLREPSIAIVEPLVERAHEGGELRADFGAIDLLIGLQMVATVVAKAAAGLDVDRYVGIVVRGLRPDQA